MKINKQSVLIGSDFELFLTDENGKFISAIPFNNGTKKFPEKLPREGCCLQYDNTSQEANVPPVKIDESGLFWSNVEYIKDYILSKYAKENKLKITCCPTAEFTEDQLDHPDAKQAGCEPSYNAWLNGEMNQACNLAETNLRVAGGHLHFSFEGADIQNCIDLMKVFDTFVSIPCIFLDSDTRRRELYGKAGEMRLCEWGETRGFEARTLSNFWVEDQEYVDYIFNQINQMFDYYNEHGVEKIESWAGSIVDAINSNNKELAGKICDEFGILVLIKNEENKKENYYPWE